MNKLFRKHIKKQVNMQIGGHDSLIYSQHGLLNCPNCDRRFPSDKLDIHQAYCSRNYRKCQLCGIMVDKNSMEEHKNQQHSLKPCQFCGECLMGRELLMHQDACLAKPEKCNYCLKPCPKGQLNAHQQACGLKLKQCNICQKMFPIKDLATHTQRCKNPSRLHRQNSQQQRNQIKRELPRQSSQNQLNLKQKQKQKTEQPKPQATRLKNIIPKQQIKQSISPIPISIQLTLRQKASINQQPINHKSNRKQKEQH